MDIELDLNQEYTIEEGKKLICYEKTERFAFLCPYKLINDNSVELNIAETMVYSMDTQDETPLEAIETLLVSK
ncbi:hypothetical protein FDB41_11820 [Clostridium botulinum]|nr:hypothetical protein [Clostridium botulinum]NFO30958.1 hypothetical protein [Clostridium botulinum]NFO54217.1 hypothetical protein [Clostridium botulinum]